MDDQPLDFRSLHVFGTLRAIVEDGYHHCLYLWDVSITTSTARNHPAKTSHRPWALACWAPFAFMGIEINRLTAPNTMLANGSSYRRLSMTDNDFSSPAPSPTFLRLNHLDRDIDDSADASTGETAGIYLGILNLFTTLPQFVGTFISMIVFSVLEPGKSPELHKDPEQEGMVLPDPKKAGEGPNAIAVCLFIGALSAVGAAYATARMKAAR